MRITKNPDYYFLGFRGYELFWPVRIITYGKLLIYDHMMSPYDSLLNERKSIRRNSFLDKLLFQYEKYILKSSDIIITDTSIHRHFFSELFNIPLIKIFDIPVAADEEIFYRSDLKQETPKTGPFEVLFYGSFLPLHGVDIILDAATSLKDFPIHFTLVGGNQNNPYSHAINQAKLINISQVEWVEFEKLPELIAKSDIGLGGPFGDTGQSQRVITTKTFQFLAMAKPVIIGESAQEFGFKDKYNCLSIPRGNSNALTDSIIWAFEHPDQIIQIGQKGFDLYRERYSLEIISNKLRELI